MKSFYKNILKIILCDLKCLADVFLNRIYNIR